MPSKPEPASISNGMRNTKTHIVASASAFDQAGTQVAVRAHGYHSAHPEGRDTGGPGYSAGGGKSASGVALLAVTSFDTGLEIPIRIQTLTSFCTYSIALQTG